MTERAVSVFAEPFTALGHRLALPSGGRVYLGSLRLPPDRGEDCFSFMFLAEERIRKGITPVPTEEEMDDLLDQLWSEILDDDWLLEAAYRGPQKCGCALPPPKTVASDSPMEPHAILGVASGTQLSAIRKTFLALVAEQHPDKHSHRTREEQEAASERTRVLIEAWETIRRSAPDGR